MKYNDMTKDQLLSALENMEQRLLALKASEKQYRETLESVGDAISIQDTEYKILYQNRAHKKLMGDQTGRYCYSAYRQNEHICDNCHLEKAFRDGEVHTGEQTGITEGGPISVEITASPLKDVDGKIVAGIEAVRNITERRKSEEALRLAEAKFRSLVEQALVGIYIIQDNRCPYVNPRAAEIFGYTPAEMSGLPVDDLIHEDDRGMVKENIRRRVQDEVNTVHYTFRGRKKDGTAIDIEVQGTRTEFEGRPAIIGSLLDVTERRKTENERSRMQNLESLGVFASGVAHEYNNLLTAIIGNLSLAKMYAKPGYEVYDVLTEAEKASVRAKDLTSQLLMFAEGSRIERNVVDLKESLKQWVGEVLVNSPVRSEFSLQQDLRSVEADELQLKQVIDNIVINARQSMTAGGLLKVRAENMDISADSELPLGSGKYVVISIEDHGVGIPEKLLVNIFDPFYTTRQQSSGLGLASSYSIIKKHNGHITVESRLGVGTTFHIYLPVFQRMIVTAEASPKTFSPGKGRVLVMDDEEIVRLVVSKLLSQCGYDSELARDGAEMLKMYKTALESGQPFDAVVMDLVIEGGMGGQEAIKYLLETDPHAKAIVSSGYSNAPVMSHFTEFGFSGFLAKPYRLEELGKVLSEVLNKQGQ